MNTRGIIAAAVGVVAALVTFVTVTELLSPSIEFSVFLGLPAGVVAGVVVTAAVLFGFRTDDDRSQMLAAALVAAALVFLVAFGVLLVGVGVGAVVALVPAVGLATVGGLVVFLWLRDAER
jgi:predicted neutral ceramidase superfamily lipid hydrolase